MNSWMKHKDRRTSKHLIVISYDAFSEENWELARTLPNFSSLLSLGSHSTKLKSVYPTLTYTVHTTIVTGVYPDKHGIIHNNPLQPFIRENQQDWYWFRKDIKVPTLYDAAKEKGLRTAGILWPVTGKASLRYNLPEIAAIKDESQVFKILKNGTPAFCISMAIRHGRSLQGPKQPYLDDFTASCAIDTIKRKKPHLLLMHLIELDDAKHRYGTDSIEVTRTVERMDKRLGCILRAVKDAGMSKDTVIAIVGDHGQFNVQKEVHLNNFLRDAGLITEDKGVLTWRAYFQSAGGSAYLHIKPGDQQAQDVAAELMENMAADPANGIQRLYSRKELNDFHVDQSIKYMAEARIGYGFTEVLGAQTIEDLNLQHIKYATHGYSPDKPNYRCNMLISGPGIKQGYEVGDIEMVDIAPTLARILQLDLNGCDGRTLDEIFLS